MLSHVIFDGINSSGETSHVGGLNNIFMNTLAFPGLNSIELPFTYNDVYDEFNDTVSV